MHKASVKRSILPLVALWISLFLWGTHGPIGRFLALKGIPILGVMTARIWITSAIYWLTLLVARKLEMGFLRKNWGKILLLASFGMYLNMLSFHAGMKYIPATLVLLLENLSPFFVIFFVWILEKTRPGKIEILFQSIAFLGLLLIVYGGVTDFQESSTFLLGISLELLAAFTWAVYSYFSNKLLIRFSSDRENPDVFSLTLNFTCVLFTVTSLIASPHILSLSTVELSPMDVSMIVFLGIFPTAGSFLLWNYALANLPVSRVSTSFYMTIVFTCINEILFLNFLPSWNIILGSILILGSALSLTIFSETADSPAS